MKTLILFVCHVARDFISYYKGPHLGGIQLG